MDNHGHGQLRLIPFNIVSAVGLVYLSVRGRCFGDQGYTRLGPKSSTVPTGRSCALLFVRRPGIYNTQIVRMVSGATSSESPRHAIITRCSRTVVISEGSGINFTLTAAVLPHTLPRAHAQRLPRGLRFEPGDRQRGDSFGARLIDCCRQPSMPGFPAATKIENPALRH